MKGILLKYFEKKGYNYIRIRKIYPKVWDLNYF